MTARKTQFLIEDLISKIFQQQFPGEKLPAERVLAQEYKVSRYTVQQALRRLEAMGMIYRRQGDGIYIRRNAQKFPMVYNSATQIQYSDLRSEMLSLRRIRATPELLQVFNIPPEEEVWEFRRVRIMDYSKSQIETGYLPCSLFPYVDREVVEDSIQNFAMEQGYRIARFMTIYRPTQLTREEAELLSCRKGEPAFSITSRGYLRDGRIFVHSNITAIHYECTYIVPFNKEVYTLRRNQDKHPEE